MSEDNNIMVRFDATGGGATITTPRGSETYTYAFGNAVSRFGMLALLGGDPGIDGAEDLYRERLRAELLAQIHAFGVRLALRHVFDIT